MPLRDTAHICREVKPLTKPLVAYSGDYNQDSPGYTLATCPMNTVIGGINIRFTRHECRCGRGRLQWSYSNARTGETLQGSGPWEESFTYAVAARATMKALQGFLHSLISISES